MKKEFQLRKILIDVSEGPDGQPVVGNYYKQGEWIVTEDDGSEFSRKADSIKVDGDDPQIKALFGNEASLQAQIERMNGIHAQLAADKAAAVTEAAERVAAAGKIAEDASNRAAAWEAKLSEVHSILGPKPE